MTASRTLLLALMLGLAPSLAAAPSSADWVSGGIRACAFASPQSAPALVSDGAGGTIVAWLDRRNADVEVYAQRITSDGRLAWAPDGVPVSVASFQPMAVSATPDGFGGVIVAWSVKDGTTRHVYAQRLNASGVVAASWPVGGTLLGRRYHAEGVELAPRCVTDGSGGAWVSWNFSWGINLQYVSATGAVPPGWGDGLVVASFPWPDGCRSGLTTDGSGGVIVGSLSRSNTPAVASRFQTATPNWSWQSTSTNAGFGVDLVSDLAGGAMVAWLRYSGNSLVQVERMNASGQTPAPWPVGGVVVGTTPVSFPEHPRIASDGSGGALIPWITAGPPQQLALQRVLGSATIAPGWPAGGFVLGGSAIQWSIDGDGSGGAYAAWIEPGGNLYAQHVTASGSVGTGWAAGGLPIAPAGPGTEADPAVILDGAGGALMAWTDTRDGEAHIYAFRVGPAGLLDVGEVAPAGRRGLSLALAGSNPVTGTLEVRLTLDSDPAAALHLFDAAGRVVHRTDLGHLADGSHSMRIELPPGTPGIYFARLSDSDEARTLRFARLR